MKETDSDDERAPRVLADAIFEGAGASPMPPIVDGAPVPPPPVALRVLRDEDWVCLRGPCRHYHWFRYELKAMAPLEYLGGPEATQYEDGTPIEPFSQTRHYCYVSPGNEMDMTDEVVTACNRWDPEDVDHDPEAIARGDRRRRWAARQLERVPGVSIPEDLEAELARADLAAAPRAPRAADPLPPFRPDGKLGIRCASCRCFLEPPKSPAPGTEDAYCWNKDHQVEPADPGFDPIDAEAPTAVDTPIAKRRPKK